MTEVVTLNKSDETASLLSIAGIKAIAKKFISGFMEHDLLTLAAALAFYTALALAPLLLITLSVVGLLGEASKNTLMIQIQSLMGEQASVALNSIIESANNNPKTGSAAGLIGILALLFSASGVFAQLQSSLNVIWHATGKASSGAWSWMRKRLLSMGLVLTLGFLALVSLLISSVLAFLFTQKGLVWQGINFFVSGLIFSALFALIFKYLPDAKMTWRSAWFGAVITAILFMVGKSLIGVYLGKSAVGSAYGAAGSLIVLLAWVYYSSIIVFSGAEITRIAADHDESFKKNLELTSN